MLRDAAIASIISIRGIDVERHVAYSLVGRIFGELVVKNDLQSIVDFERHVGAFLSAKAKLLDGMSGQNSKVYDEKTDWFRSCPVCGSGELGKVSFLG